MSLVRKMCLVDNGLESYIFASIMLKTMQSIQSIIGVHRTQATLDYIHPYLHDSEVRITRCENHGDLEERMYLQQPKGYIKPKLDLNGLK